MASRAITVFLVLGFVSLLADAAYEGARSIVGPYAELLGASATAVSVFVFGEAVSYLSRVAGGVIAYKIASPGAYWGLLIFGYAVNLFAVPLLALAGDWLQALALVMVERAGKGIRVPVRDAIIAEVGWRLGRGKAFAVHEVLDQAGGVLGPAMIAYSMSRGASYGEALLLLAAPALMALALVALGPILYRELASAEPVRGALRGLPRPYWALTLGLSVAALGFPHWFVSSTIVAGAGYEAWVPALYAVAMLVDGVAALALGLLYDRAGAIALLAVPVATASSAMALLGAGQPLVHAALYGVAIGAYESIAKAAIADHVKPGLRALAYTLTFTLVGVGWGAGNLLIAAAGVGVVAVLSPVTLAASATLILAAHPGSGKRG